MKTRNKVPRPFWSGSCRRCRRNPFATMRQLCPSCRQFADQDYGSQLEALYSAGDLERISDQNQYFAGSYGAAQKGSGGSDLKRKHTTTVFAKAGLSKREKQIVKLVFAEHMTHEAVSKYLRISRGSVYQVTVRVREKLQICLARALLSKGTHFSNRPRANPSRPTLITRSMIAKASARESIQAEAVAITAVPDAEETETKRRGSLRRICPRCGDRVFCAERDFQYCFNCLWDSDSDGNRP